MHRFRMNQKFQKFSNFRKSQWDYNVIDTIFLGLWHHKNILSENGYWFYAINDSSTVWESGSNQIIGHLQCKC